MRVCVLEAVELLLLHNATKTTILLPFIWDYPGEPVPERNIHPLSLTPILIINDPLSISSIYSDL